MLVSGIRTLVVAGTGKPPESELRQMIADDAMPDAVSAEDAINATYLDDRFLATVPGLRGRLLRRLPYLLAWVIELLLVARRYDVVVTWSDLRSIIAAAVLRVWSDRPAHVAIVFWPSRPKKAIPLRLLQRSVDRFICGSPVQVRYLEERLGIAPERIIRARVPVDTRFWRPIGDERDLICAVGQEMRDYATLIEALRPLDIPCHIAAGTHIFGTTSDRWWKGSLAGDELPATVTIGPKNFTDLRQLYARARFVVVPLLPSDNDSGITTILEAFAMGKAVIATDTPGQVGVLREGVNCVRVPPLDPVALRKAINMLWNDPELCTRLGAAGREFVVASEGIDKWTDALVQAVLDALAVHRPDRCGHAR